MINIPAAVQNDNTTSFPVGKSNYLVIPICDERFFAALSMTANVLVILRCAQNLSCAVIHRTKLTS